jgi:ABC-type transport system involved in multi-copper enzyme maturation permease subunit
MLRIILKKELHDNFLNLRLISLCAIAIVLIVSSIIVLTGQYRDDLNDTHSRISTQNEFIDRYGHANRIGWMSVLFREPSPWRPFITGIDRDASQENFINNPIPALLSRLDVVSIIAVIMSLIAVIIAHNGVSGERESGMLKLMLSMSVPRSTILLGKFIAGLITLSIPCTLGILLGLAYLSITVGIEFDILTLGVFGFFLFLALLYVQAFYGLGLLISARSHSSNVAVLKSLFAWVVLVLALPNISPFLAAQMYTIPSRARHERELRKIESEDRDARIRQQMVTAQKEIFPDGSLPEGISRSEIQERMSRDPVFREQYTAFMKRFDAIARQVNIEQRRIGDALREDFNNRSRKQELLAIGLASLSPLSNFVFAATDAADVGLESDAEWEAQAGRYNRSLREYVDKRYEEAKASDPSFSVNDYLDLRTRPRFQFQPPPLGTRIVRIILPTAILAGFNLLFFVAAFVSFLRYDVR